MTSAAKTLSVPRTASLAGALAATSLLCGICVLPLRLAGYRLERPLRSLQSAGTSQERFGLAKRVAAAALVGAAICIFPVGGWLIPNPTATYTVRFDVNNELQLTAMSALSRSDLTPLNAMAQWIDPAARWRVLGFNRWNGTAPLKLMIDLAPAETPLLPPTAEQIEQIQQRLAQ